MRWGVTRAGTQEWQRGKMHRHGLHPLERGVQLNVTLMAAVVQTIITAVATIQRDPDRTLFYNSSGRLIWQTILLIAVNQRINFLHQVLNPVFFRLTRLFSPNAPEKGLEERRPLRWLQDLYQAPWFDIYTISVLELAT